MITSPKASATPRWSICCVVAPTTIAPQPAKTRTNVPTNSAASRRTSAGAIIVRGVSTSPAPGRRLRCRRGRRFRLARERLEHVADAEARVDEARRARAAVDLVAQALDADVHGAVAVA